MYRMRTIIRGISTALALAASVAATIPLAYAHSYGPKPGVSGAPGETPGACTQCHAGGAVNSGAGSVAIQLPSGAFYTPGVKQRLTVLVSDPNQQRWGFQLTARLNSDLQNAQAGDLSPVDGMTQVICGDYGPKPCASGPQFIEHTSFGTRNGTKGGAAFQFDWTPPATNAGTVTLFVAGNAANGNGTNAGDLIYTSSVQLNPAVPVAPVISAGDVLSSATETAIPVTANSWVTVYGSNLASTTRAWNTGDFLGGVMPFSLDGVSVILTGAPRLAYVGYVSPTQVNFLVPSDQSATTVQVQIRNAAGITTQVPLVIQASAPQLLTVDGKHVSGTHANGSGISATAPATPGETVTLNATACGAANPALIPGLLPAVNTPLATAATATVGGASATVTSAVYPAGSAGVCQVTLQVPAAAANGDQPVVVTQGTASSVPVMLTVQR